jgi:drug/metabolite transporter (DMT)-like permease
MALHSAARATDVVGGLALVVAWSSGFIGAELGTRDASASTLLAWRYVVAAAVLVLLVAWTRRGWRVRRPWRHAVIGLLCQATYLGGVVGGVGLGVPPGTAALIAAGQPLMVSVLERVLLGRTPSVRQRVGLALGVVGVALVVSSDLGRGSAPAGAYLLPLAGTLGLSVGTVLDRRWRLDDDVLTGLTAQTAVVAVVMLGGAQVGGDLAPPTSSMFWLAVAWVVVLSTFGGYGLYFWVLRRSGASAVSTWLYLTPPCTMLWAAVAFGDRPGPVAYMGTAICALAVVVWTGVARHITLVPYISPRGSAISSSRAPLGSRK